MPIQESDLEKFRELGDPEADAALVEIWPKLTPKQQSELLPILGKWNPSHRLDELPVPIREYVAKPFDMPSWIIPDRVKRAQAAYDRHKSGVRIILATYSLPILYIHPEISLTLATTGQLLLHVRRRYIDTQSFVEGVMEPKSLEPGEPGQLWIRRVRLTHAAVRRAILAKTKPADSGHFSPLWESADVADLHLRYQMFGAVDDKVPLDQTELALVLQTFAWVVIEGLAEMGWSMTRDEAADHVHAWSVIGHMLGIDEKLLPHSGKAVAEAESLFVLIRDFFLREGDPLGPDSDDQRDTRLAGRLLVAAWITFLVQVQREKTPQDLRGLLTAWPRLDEALQQLPRILIRRLCGDAAARYLRIGHAGWFDRFASCLAMRLIDPRKFAADFDEPPNGSLSGALL